MCLGPSNVWHRRVASNEVSALVGDCLEKVLRFVNRWGITLMNRLSRSQRVYICQRLFEHELVKEQNRVEGLVLGAGRYVASQVKTSNFCLEKVAGQSCN